MLSLLARAWRAYLDLYSALPSSLPSAQFLHYVIACPFGCSLKYRFSIAKEENCMKSTYSSSNYHLFKLRPTCAAYAYVCLCVLQGKPFQRLLLRPSPLAFFFLLLRPLFSEPDPLELINRRRFVQHASLADKRMNNGRRRSFPCRLLGDFPGE